ncbi:MAG: TIGR03936 family radical SAM-associated protein [Pseudomonadota bacterium]
MSQDIAQPLFRYRLCFGKRGPLRFLGHLDLMHIFERTFRRARVPLVYGQGYRSRPRFQIANALPFGHTSEGELADVWLKRQFDSQELLKVLQNSVPLGLWISDVSEIEPCAPSLPSQVVSAEYEVCLDPDSDISGTTIKALLDAEKLPRARRGKSYDLRPLIEHLELASDSNGVRVRMCLLAKEGATGRADEVLAALGLDSTNLIVHRLRILLQRYQVVA